MANEELKKKIAGILKKAMEPIEYGGDGEHAPEVHYPTEEEIADALIAAGIGDVKEAEHRAARAERALENACVVILSSRNGDQPRRLRAYYKAYLEAAEKELAEERKDD